MLSLSGLTASANFVLFENVFVSERGSRRSLLKLFIDDLVFTGNLLNVNELTIFSEIGDSEMKIASLRFSLMIDVET